MSEQYVTASECLNQFKNIGLDITKGAFSKQKAKGIYRIYHKENSKREYFIFEEVLSDYLGSTLPLNDEEDRIRTEIEIKFKVQKMINEQNNIIWGYRDLSPEMFDIGNLYDEAQNNLKIMENEILEGKDIDTATKEYILKEATKTQEEHIQAFKKEVYETNQTRLDFSTFSDVLCEELEEVYSEFRGSGFEYNILKIIANWMSLSDPKKFADSCDVSVNIIKNEEV